MRVAIAPRQIRLGDDKERAMRNDIYAMRKDPERRDAGDAVIDFPSSLRSRRPRPLRARRRWTKLACKLFHFDLVRNGNGNRMSEADFTPSFQPARAAFQHTPTRPPPLPAQINRFEIMNPGLVAALERSTSFSSLAKKQQGRVMHAAAGQLSARHLLWPLERGTLTCCPARGTMSAKMKPELTIEYCAA